MRTVILNKQLYYSGSEANTLGMFNTHTCLDVYG